MLIIAIGYGNDVDPYSCVAKPDDSDKVDGTDKKSVLDFICKKQGLQEDWIDELLVIENDEVKYVYTLG